MVSTSSTPKRLEPLKTSNYLSSSSVRLGLAKSYLIRAIRQLFTDHAAGCSLQPQNDRAHRESGTQVAVANTHHAPQCNSATDHAVYSARLEVGHLTVVDVKMSNRSRNSTSVEQCAFAFRGWHQIAVIPTSAEGNSNRMRQFRKQRALIDHQPPSSRTSPAPASGLFPNGKRL